MYKGPFRQVIDDEGRVFVRARRVPVPATVAAQLRSGEWASQFTLLEATASRPATVTACRLST